MIVGLQDYNDIFGVLYRRFIRFQGDTDPYTLTGGRFYRTAAPQDAVEPYIVVTMVSGSIDRLFGGHINVARIQMDVWDRRTRSTDLARAMSIYNGLSTIYDSETLTAMDGSTALIMRQAGMPTEEADADYLHVFGDWTIERQVTL